MIGHDAQLAVRQEHAPALGQESVLHHAVLVVLGLGPRVGEVQVHAAHARGGGAPLQKPARVGVHHADVGEPAPAEAVGRVQVKLARVLDAEIVHLGIGRGFLEHEPALAAADLDLEGAIGVLEPCTRIEPTRLRVGHDRVRKRGKFGGCETDDAGGIVECAAMSETE